MNKVVKTYDFWISQPRKFLAPFHHQKFRGVSETTARIRGTRAAFALKTFSSVSPTQKNPRVIPEKKGHFVLQRKTDDLKRMLPSPPKKMSC